MPKNEQAPMGYYVVHIEMTSGRNVALRAHDRADLTDEQVILRTLNHMKKQGDLEIDDDAPVGGEVTILRFETEAAAKQAFDSLGPPDAIVMTHEPASATLH